MASVGPGLYDVLFLDPRGLKDVTAFSINVVHDGGSGQVHGSALIQNGRRGNDDDD